MVETTMGPYIVLTDLSVIITVGIVTELLSFIPLQRRLTYPCTHPDARRRDGLSIWLTCNDLQLQWEHIIHCIG